MPLLGPDFGAGLLLVMPDHMSVDLLTALSIGAISNPLPHFGDLLYLATTLFFCVELVDRAESGASSPGLNLHFALGFGNSPHSPQI